MGRVVATELERLVEVVLQRWKPIELDMGELDRSNMAKGKSDVGFLYFY